MTRAGKVFTHHPGPHPHEVPREAVPLLKVIASAVILAILGILYVVYNPHDDKMAAFGWSLVAIGAIIAGAFVYLLTRGEGPEPETGPRRRRG